MTDLPAFPRDVSAEPSPVVWFDPRPKPRSIFRALKGLAGLLGFTAIVFVIWIGIQ